jgi:tetratricopeptide (TPR) repeat protein
MTALSAMDGPLGTPAERTTQIAAEPTPAKLYEQAVTLNAMGFHQESLDLLRDVTQRAPDHAPAWMELASLLRFAGRDEEARAAASRGASRTIAWEPVVDARTPAEIDAEERRLRDRMRALAEPPAQLKALIEQLRQNEADVAAMRLLGRLEWRSGALLTARALFEWALTLAPQYEGAREDLARLLPSLGDNARAVAETGMLIQMGTRNFDYRALHADALLGVGNIHSAISLVEDLIQEESANLRLRCVYAQSLHFAGRREESVREFRRCLELQPGMGEAYWGIAELRGDFLTADDIAAMRTHLCETEMDRSSRMLMQYALGHASERAGDYAQSFRDFDAAAALARTIAADAGESYNPAKDADQVRRRQAVFTADLFRMCATTARKTDVTPIFIVGMPRAGSTLVEQILASHSAVEATIELPVLGNIVRDLSLSRLLVTRDAYPECIRDLRDSDLSELGARYLEEAAAYRRTDAPYFVDKRPWNWLEAGLIRLILPHARIIDVRRGPMASCFAMYKQMLENSATFSYDFEDLAQYYTQYLGMMEHWARVMPGQINFLSYEHLVENTETEIRRLLDHCRLPFEEGCLRFWETDRVISTPSAEQVRRPIFRDAVDHWRKFEPWLGALKEELKKAKAEAAATPQPADYEYALTLAAMSMHGPAIEELRSVTVRVPSHAGAWKELSELLRLAGEDAEADAAAAAGDHSAGEACNWRPTYDARTPRELDAAERKFKRSFSTLRHEARLDMLQEHLLSNPADAAATHVLSELEEQNDDDVTALSLLERTVELAPRHHMARAELYRFLRSRGLFVRALEQISILMRHVPLNPDYRAMHSDALSCVGEVSAALTIMEELVQAHPRYPAFWLSYGQQLQAVGRHEECARAFRTCLELVPTMGAAYSGLANLKTGLLTGGDIDAMRNQLAKPALEPENRMHMYYALGSALEQASEYSASFNAYEQGARLFRGHFLRHGDAYSEDDHIERLRRLKQVYTAKNLAAHGGSAARSTGSSPIFIVGLPRAGSTLVEQILSTHSQVEATRELSIIDDITRDLSFSRRVIDADVYPECVLDMPPARLAALGERYLREAQFYRKTARLWFTDKRPWNWMEIGLIQLILPHARIVDVRREPLAACFAMFKQILPTGADFSNDLRDAGRYYVEYAAMMDHYARELPGRVHLVQYEHLVDNPEYEIRRMLDYCDLPFDENCLRFWQTERVISTPSAEQVRKPIYRDAIEKWRNFEPWLGPLKSALSEPARA